MHAGGEGRGKSRYAEVSRVQRLDTYDLPTQALSGVGSVSQFGPMILDRLRVREATQADEPARKALGVLPGERSFLSKRVAFPTPHAAFGAGESAITAKGETCFLLRASLIIGLSIA